mmetsp:Transcript_28712/g.68085  ORF Transcript_28712/g.68085 Transcript_28712/m.68085 type:complete len:242 (-) Transcript_28712:19-744(-)
MAGCSRSRTTMGLANATANATSCRQLKERRYARSTNMTTFALCSIPSSISRRQGTGPVACKSRKSAQYDHPLRPSAATKRRLGSCVSLSRQLCDNISTFCPPDVFKFSTRCLFCTARNSSTFSNSKDCGTKVGVLFKSWFEDMREDSVSFPLTAIDKVALSRARGSSSVAVSEEEASGCPTSATTLSRSSTTRWPSIVTGASMGDLEKRWRAASAMMMMMPFTPEHVCRQQCNDDAVMMRV